VRGRADVDLRAVAAAQGLEPIAPHAELALRAPTTST
jgi:hypothetical protein